MKYKVGDRVKVKDLNWYNKNKDNYGRIVECGKISFVEDMSEYCGQIATITKIFNDKYYYLNIDNRGWTWTDDMFEELVEEPITLNSKEVLLKLANIELPSGTTNIWECPKGYQFVDENGNVINATKIVLEKKKKEYPKTFRECCEIIGFCSDTLKWSNPFCINRNTHPYIKHIDNLMERFCKLLICRDAYWKIAGEEMGLGKSWEPDWTDHSKIKYAFRVCRNSIQEYEPTTWATTFTFPTEEMRDAFKKNFDKDLETCKELL